MSKLLFCACILLLCTSCDKNISSPTPTNEKAKISIEQLADRFGDWNDEVSNEEVKYVQEYFNINGEAWIITSHLNNFEEAVHADTVSKRFLVLSEPYKSSSELKNAYKGIAIKTPVVGICKIINDQNYYIVELYSCPGASVYTSEWKRIVIVK
mgnify:FL=1